MNRRKLLIALGAGALAAPLASLAQQKGKVWRVGFLGGRSRPASPDADSYGEFRRGMRELGYVEGRNLVIESRFADAKPERLPGLAAALVQLKVDVIVTGGNQAISAAQKATATIPILMAAVIDPVATGFARSLARPGGNLTGLANMTTEISSKHLELLLSVAPKLAVVAVLVNPTNTAHPGILKTAQAAGQSRNVKILRVTAQTAQEIENAFSTAHREKAGAIIVALDAVFTEHHRQIAGLAAKHRLPSVYMQVLYAEGGGLMSYGQNLAENFRLIATYVDKIFKGAKPADLPIEQPTRFELVVNMKTAKALGITIPQSILVRADRVIE